MITKINESYAYLKEIINGFQPEIGIVLGTGLGALINEVDIIKSIDYSDIPHFPVSTVESHSGKLIFAQIENKKVMIMQGRFHYYEGYSMQEIVFPIRIMKKFAIHSVLISNACGGMNPQFKKGQIALITDHINLLGDNPLIGPNLDDFGPRFPDMSEPYDEHLADLAESIAIKNGIRLQRSVYVAVAGPNLETRAEYRFLRGIGADVVGMSTVPEVIVARHQDMKVLALGVITDECFPDALEEAKIEDVIRVASQTEPHLTRIMKELIIRI